MAVAGDRAEEIRRRYLSVDTSNVADVLDELGLPDQGLAPEFAPYSADGGKLAGWAYTIRGEMSRVPDGCRRPGEDGGLRAATPGTVSVWSGRGEGVCFFGELISIGMKERGCVGALVDGGIRDVDWIGELGFPVYARYRTPVQSIGRWKVTGSGDPGPDARCDGPRGSGHSRRLRPRRRGRSDRDPGAAGREGVGAAPRSWELGKCRSVQNWRKVCRCLRRWQSSDTSSRPGFRRLSRRSRGQGRYSRITLGDRIGLG